LSEIYSIPAKPALDLGKKREVSNKIRTAITPIGGVSPVKFEWRSPRALISGMAIDLGLLVRSAKFSVLGAIADELPSSTQTKTPIGAILLNSAYPHPEGRLKSRNPKKPMPKFRDLMAASAIVAIAFNSIEAGASTPTPDPNSLQPRPPQSDSWQTVAEIPSTSSPVQETVTVTPEPVSVSPVETPDVIEPAEPTPDSVPTSLQETPETAIAPSSESSINPDHVEPQPASNLTESSPAPAPSSNTVPEEAKPLDVRTPALPANLIQAQQNSTETLTETVIQETAQTPLNGNTDPTPPAILEPSPNPLLFPTRPGEVEVKDTVPITLEQAIAHAREYNLQLQRSILELEQSREAVTEARATLFPTVDLQAAYSRTDSAFANLTEGDRNQSIEAQNQQIEEQNRQREQQGLPPLATSSLASSISNTLTGQIRLSYDIYSSGAGSARRKTAERQMRLQELEVERISEEIRLNVSTAYYNLQEADENIRINEAAVRNAQKSLEDAQALERAGVGTQFDVLRAEVNLANAQQDLTQSVGDQRTARRQLAQLLNISQTTSLLAADEVKIAGLWEPTLEQTIVMAMKNRAELEQQLVQRDISEQQRRLALSQVRPQLTVNADLNLASDLDTSLDIAGGSSVQVVASWRLFDGGAARSQARQQEINGDIAANRFADLRNEFRFEVERFYSDLEANLESIQTAQKALEQSQEALELARLRFQAGVGTQTEVIDSETDLTRAEGNLITAIIGYNRSLVGLQRAVSNDPFTDPVLD
jgi:outer membrane protein TolC